MSELDYDLIRDSLPQLGAINKYKLESGCRHISWKETLFLGTEQGKRL